MMNIILPLLSACESVAEKESFLFILKQNSGTVQYRLPEDIAKICHGSAQECSLIGSRIDVDMKRQKQRENVICSLAGFVRETRSRASGKAIS